LIRKGYLGSIGLGFYLISLAWSLHQSTKSQAALALERRTTTDGKEQAWQEVAFTGIYRA
jgi:hypothetical protein